MTESLTCTLPSTSGRLQYLPAGQPTSPDDSSPAPFQQRPRRRACIQIAQLPQHLHFLDTAEGLNTSKNATKDGKLAGPRENAKRFLRSAIASHASVNTPTTASPQQSRPRSESDGGVRSGGTAGGAGQGMLSETLSRNHARSTVGGPATGALHRPSLVDSVRTGSGMVMSGTGSVRQTSQAIPDEKPVASGNGLAVGISLAEPFLFLQGFEQDSGSRTTAMLRGSLHLKVNKSAKIRAITLKFRGRSITKWPEGIPPKKLEFEEINDIMSHTWPFFNAQFPTAEAGPCADYVELYKSTTTTTLSSGKRGFVTIEQISPSSSTTNLSAKDQRKLSLQVNQSRSFGKGDSSTGGPSVAQKGYRVFHPGDYLYNFELPLDSSLSETIDVELGSVKYELEAAVERAGTFKSNLIGSKEVMLIRAPAESSLEQVEPIAISRNWEDQLHYDIVISGKSFPLGAQVPIAFKLTPLAKVQCHRIKVFVTENIEYFCSNKRVHRMEPTRKVQLFEKRADGPSISTFPGSTIRVTSGGGIPYDQRDAAARGEEVQPQDPNNLLGNLESDSNIGPTEMEAFAQLPSCFNMKDRDRSQRLHFDTTYTNIQVHHWIKIVMRLSKPDATDPRKRRHFEISIDSPFHILSCHATQANTSLPAYSTPQSANDSAELAECGCPGAPRRRGSPTSFTPTLNALNSSRESRNSSEGDALRSPGLARPQQAHIGGPNGHHVQRPIHMLRAPSFNPPAFEDEEPPPPLVTPPPQYDSIASPSNGLADYFSRLADTYDEESDDEPRLRSPARVEIPLTPGGRPARSMDLPRSWVPIARYV